MKSLLVLGCGNPLRRDDGAGPEVVRRLEAIGLEGIETIEAHQLLPEHAEVLSRFPRAVFIDASVTRTPGLRVEPVAPADGAGFTPHHSDPPEILALAARLFGHAPESWLIAIPALDLDIGEGLSPEVDRLCNQAVTEVRRLHESGFPHAGPESPNPRDE